MKKIITFGLLLMVILPLWSVFAEEGKSAVSVSASPVLSTLLVEPSITANQFSHNLYYGLRGNPEVSNLQEFLTDQGFYSGPISGNYFVLTLQAVRKFQSANGISATGYFGVKTRAMANAILDKIIGYPCESEENCPSPIPAGELKIKAIRGLVGKVDNKESFEFVISGGSGNYNIKTTGDIPGMAWSTEYSPCKYGVAGCFEKALTDKVLLSGTPISSGTYTVFISAEEKYIDPCASGPSDRVCILGFPTPKSGSARFIITIKDNPQGGSPVIESIKGPVVLKVGEEGNWSVVARDISNNSLSYSVFWGDEIAAQTVMDGKMLAPLFSQTATFAHTYNSPGKFTVRFTVRNSTGKSVVSSLTVNVVSSVTTLKIDAKEVMRVSIGSDFLETVTASGGKKPYKWSVASGSLPPGIVLREMPMPAIACLENSDCTQFLPNSIWLSGSPTRGGVYSFVLMVEDAIGSVVKKTFEIQVI